MAFPCPTGPVLLLELFCPEQFAKRSLREVEACYNVSVGGQRQVRYWLRGAVLHTGPTTEGHWIATVRHGDTHTPRWYEIDDHEVEGPIHDWSDRMARRATLLWLEAE